MRCEEGGDDNSQEEGFLDVDVPIAMLYRAKRDPQVRDGCSPETRTCCRLTLER